MTSGPIVAAVLEKDNAVADFRALIGSTDLLRQQMERLEKNMLNQKEGMLFMGLIQMKMQK